LHEQLARLLAPSVEFMFCEQLFCSPSTQYEPAGHTVQGWSPIPNVPLEHRQKLAL